MLGTGAAMIVVAALVTGLMLLKSTGRLNDFVRVVADLNNVGDGLPQKSDVKYHGVLVGEVDGVTPPPTVSPTSYTSTSSRSTPNPFPAPPLPA